MILPPIGTVLVGFKSSMTVSALSFSTTRCRSWAIIVGVAANIPVPEMAEMTPPLKIDGIAFAELIDASNVTLLLVCVTTLKAPGPILPRCWQSQRLGSES